MDSVPKSSILLMQGPGPSKTRVPEELVEETTRDKDLIPASPESAEGALPTQVVRLWDYSAAALAAAKPDRVSSSAREPLSELPKCSTGKGLSFWAVCGGWTSPWRQRPALMQKAWKDAAYGAALKVDPTDPEVEEVLTRSGVADSPLGRVPKQLRREAHKRHEEAERLRLQV